MSDQSSPLMSRFLLPGQCAVVTGGGGGIGRAVSLLLAEAGAVVAVLMLFIARGLWERIDTAWYMAVSLFCLGAIFSILFLA